jgi:hexosaminidase
MEIDTPGHFYIWGKAYPQYVMCNSLEYQIGVYCPEPPCGFMRTDNPGAVALVDDVLKDAISLTIDNFLHIG